MKLHRNLKFQVEEMEEEVESFLESTTHQEKTVTKAEDKDQK